MGEIPSMVSIQLELDEEENKIVRMVMAYANFHDKKTAIKKIIRGFGKKISKGMSAELGEL